MRILLTNDDGIMAPGLKCVLDCLVDLKWAQVDVVAPERERSAIGHAVTLHRPLQVSQVDLDGFTGLSVNGTPADCSKLAVEALLDERPDLIISGVNAGYNLGYDVLYSGTVSAAMEGVLLGIPSMAVSASGRGGEELARASTFIRRAVTLLAGCNLDPRTLLNVNVPPPEGEAEPVSITRLAHKHYKDVYDRRVDPRGRTYYWLARRELGDPEEGTDLQAVVRGRVSVTPLHFHLTDEGQIENLPQWFQLRA